MYISYLKNGFGNKILQLLYLIHYYKNLKPTPEKLYLVQAPSHHDKRTSNENILNIFPNLNKLKFLKFISWKEYDSIKKSNIPYTEIIYELDDWFTDIYFTKLNSFLKSYLTINPIYKSLLPKYDIKNGIAIHYRLGDKLMINLKHSFRYVIMKPTYFIDHCKQMLQEKTGPIYIFSDSIDLAKYLLKELPSNLIIYPNIDYIETFYLFTKFKRMIISDSTLSICAALLNKKASKIIIPYYINKHFNFYSMLYNDHTNIIKEDNEKYVMQKSDIVKLKKYVN